MKKTAFVHDWIAHEWGAEAVLRHLIRTSDHDEWVIFTYYSKQTRRRVDDKTYRIVTALPRWLNKRFIRCNNRKFILISTLFDYRNLMFWFPLLTRMLSRKIQKYKADHIVISSFAAAKNINPYAVPTTLYLHSPMQYIWENYKENLQKLSFPIKQIYQLATLYLRPRDKKKRTYNIVYFNSEYTEKLAHTLYGLKWTIIYPPLDPLFNESIHTNELCNYFVFIGRVVRYVREIDKIIRLFNTTGEPLVIIGSGPDIGYAHSIAWPNIIFTWHIDEAEAKKKMLSRARGLINLAKESFGIATAEALCSGVPVFGYKWGATEYLVDDSNGYLVDDKKEKTILEGFEKFLHMQFDRDRISHEAQERFFA